MNVLVIGSGGREHAIVWKLKQSPLVERLFCAPGNAGISELAECVNINADDFEALANFAEEKNVGLTVVGPEVPLSKGIVDFFSERKLKAFGPNRHAAMLESSKIFAKEFMRRNGIPTAKFKEFRNADKAIDYIENLAECVVKADGLAAGKGVFVCRTQADAADAVREIMDEKAFGAAGEKVIVEDLLEGEEASFLAFCDGETVKPMVASQDHKRVNDEDEGPNTGGMGAYSPAPIVSEEMQEKVMKTIMLRAVKGMNKEGTPFKGVLYAGLMIDEETKKISVLEFNARFGDPETQVILPRLESDLLPILEACVDGKLKDVEVKWKTDAATCVVMASGGYPGEYAKGKEISGLGQAKEVKEAVVFHAGTKKEDGKVLTDGGRVLGVTATGATIAQSIENAYKAVALISFEGAHYRKDIGRRALEKEKSATPSGAEEVAEKKMPKNEAEEAGAQEEVLEREQDGQETTGPETV
ncbi:MAG: phosphoribosylamine--glycine ligase [Candidatus Diapherotrites archaeon]